MHVSERQVGAVQRRKHLQGFRKLHRSPTAQAHQKEATTCSITAQLSGERACFSSCIVYIASAHFSSFHSLHTTRWLIIERRCGLEQIEIVFQVQVRTGAHRLSSGKPFTFSRISPSTPPSRRISAAPVPMKPSKVGAQMLQPHKQAFVLASNCS